MLSVKMHFYSLGDASHMKIIAFVYYIPNFLTQHRFYDARKLLLWKWTFKKNFCKTFTLKGTKLLVLLKIKKPIQTNESAFVGGEYRIEKFA